MVNRGEKNKKKNTETLKAFTSFKYKTPKEREEKKIKSGLSIRVQSFELPSALEKKWKI